MYGPWQQIRAADVLSSRPNRSRQRTTHNGKYQQNKRTVLVVDDEHLIADTMREILKRSGFHAIAAYDGQEGLRTALQVTPDVVLTDIVMPQMNGVQLAIAIRKALPSVDIILLSGQAGITDILERATREGYTFDLISKPVHPEKLLQRLRKG